MTKYAVDHGEEGWAVYDRGTGRAVRIDGRLQNDLSFNLATELAVTLNRIAEHRDAVATMGFGLTEDDLAADEPKAEVVNLATRIPR